MRVGIFCAALVLSSASWANADRILIDKATGDYLPSWYDSYARPGTLLENATRNGDFTAGQIEEREISRVQWHQIRRDLLDVPTQAAQAERRRVLLEKKLGLKTKLNLSEAEWQDLQSAIRELP